MDTAVRRFGFRRHDEAWGRDDDDPRGYLIH